MVVLVFNNHSWVGRYSEPNQSVSEVSGSDRLDVNDRGNRNIHLENNSQQKRSIIEGHKKTGKPRDITTASEYATLSGRVGTEFGENAAGETVVLFSPSQKIRYSIITGVSGEYIFTDIEPGWDYVLKIVPRGMYESYTRSQLKLRSDREVHDIVLKSIPLGSLTGRVVDPYDRPVAGIELFLTTVEKEYRTTRAVTDANGDFSVARFPRGKFQLAIKGEQTIKATGLKFDPDTYVPLILTIDRGPYNLEGGIYDESGRIFDGADVYLIWALHKNDFSIRSTRKVSADTSGEFRFTGLGPGKHELSVSAWRGEVMQKTVKQTINVGVDSGKLIVVIDTLL